MVAAEHGKRGPFYNYWWYLKKVTNSPLYILSGCALIVVCGGKRNDYSVAVII